MVAEYVVRRATVGDATAIASVHHRAWGESYRGIVPDDVLDARAPVEKRTLIWARYLERNAGFVAVACTTEGEVAGFLSCGVAEPHTGADCEVQAIYVLDAHKRRGIGRKLLRAGLDHLRNQAGQTVGLWVLDANEAACRFYEALGWRAGEVRTDSRNLKLRAYYRSLTEPFPAD